MYRLRQASGSEYRPTQPQKTKKRCCEATSLQEIAVFIAEPQKISETRSQRGAIQGRSPRRPTLRNLSSEGTRRAVTPVRIFWCLFDPSKRTLAQQRAKPMLRCTDFVRRAAANTNHVKHRKTRNENYRGNSVGLRLANPTSGAEPGLHRLNTEPFPNNN